MTSASTSSSTTVQGLEKSSGSGSGYNNNTTGRSNIAVLFRAIAKAHESSLTRGREATVLNTFVLGAATIPSAPPE